jgi:hypothetical protein
MIGPPFGERREQSTRVTVDSFVIIDRVRPKLASRRLRNGVFLMTARSCILGLLLLGGSTAFADGPANNPLYVQLREKGLTLGGVHVDLPPPSLADDASEEQERATLKAIAGSTAAVKDLTRDSVTADEVLKKRSVKAKAGVVRFIDLWFVVYADLDAFDPEKSLSGAQDGQTVGAGNMQFSGRRVAESVLAAKGIKLAKVPDTIESYSTFTGKMLDQVEFQTTNHVFAKRGERSWVIANVTDDRFNDDPAFRNAWRNLDTRRKTAAGNAWQPYDGGGGCTKMTTLKTVPGAVLVEVHSAFYEPNDWFGGGPILDSKINPAAKNQVRALREELRKRAAKAGKR